MMDKIHEPLIQMPFCQDELNFLAEALYELSKNKQVSAEKRTKAAAMSTRFGAAKYLLKHGVDDAED